MRKKIILLALLLPLSVLLKAQCWNTVTTITTDPKNPLNNSGNTFDWTVDNAINWFYDFNNSHPIHLPYFCNSGQSSAIDDGCSNQNVGYYAQIRNNNPGATQAALNKLYDILPGDGWELISYNFGSASTPNKIPHIILYNKYTAKLKIFVLAVANSGASIGNARAAVYLDWSNMSSAATALFSNANPIILPLNRFNAALSVASPNEIVSLSGFGSVPDYQWLGAEMMAAYDPCTCQNTSDGKGIPIIDFSIQYFTQTDVSLTGTVEGESAPSSSPYYSGNGLAPGVNNLNSTSISEIQGGTGSVFHGYSSWSNYAQSLAGNLAEQSGGGSGIGTNNLYINNIANSLYTQNNLGPAGQSQTYINTQVLNYINANPSAAASQASGTGTDVLTVMDQVANNAPDYVKWFVGACDLLTAVDGQSSGSPSPPTVYSVHEKISVNGTLTGHSALNHDALSLPGSSNSYGVGSAAPIYNNTLGIFNILNIPSMNSKELQVTNYGVDPSASGGFQAPYSGTIPFKFYDYKMSAPLKYVLNPAAGLTVLSIDAAYVFEYNYNDNLPLIPFLNSVTDNQKQVPYYYNMAGNWYYKTSPNTVSGDNLSTIVSNLNNSGIELEYQSQGYQSTNTAQNTPGSIIRFRTKYVPLQCFQDVDFILAGGNVTPNTYVKLYCKFQRKDNGQVITAVYTFDASDKMATPVSLGSQLSGSMYYYENDPQPSNNATYHSVVGKVYLYGAFYSPNYSNAPGSTYTSGTGGVSTTSDVNIGQYVDIYNSNGGNNQANSFVNITTLQNINYGGGIINYTSGHPTWVYDAQATLTAGKNINLGGSTIYPQTKMFAGQNVVIGNGSYIPGGTGVGVQIQAGREIQMTTTGYVTEIRGNATLTVNPAMSIDGILHGCQVPDAISNYNETGSLTASRCQGMGERLMAKPQTSASSQPDKKSPEKEMHLFPNPSDGIVFLTTGSANAAALTATISDMQGKQVMQSKFTANDGDSHFKLDLSGLNPGVYFIQINGEGGQAVKHEKLVLLAH